MMKKICHAMLLSAFLCGCGNGNTEKQAVVEVNLPVEKPLITAPPDSLGLDPFYKKYMNVNGIPVCSSWRVPDSCFHAAYITFKALTDMLPEKVMKSLTDNKARVTIMARYEGTTDVPEHAYLVNDTTINWDLRARGLEVHSVCHSALVPKKISWLIR